MSRRRRSYARRSTLPLCTHPDSSGLLASIISSRMAKDGERIAGGLALPRARGKPRDIHVRQDAHRLCGAPSTTSERVLSAYSAIHIAHSSAAPEAYAEYVLVAWGFLRISTPL